MIRSLCMFAAALAIASSAFASDVVKNNDHKHYLKTDRAAQCAMPSGKMRKDCSEQSGEPAAPMKTL